MKLITIGALSLIFGWFLAYSAIKTAEHLASSLVKQETVLETN